MKIHLALLALLTVALSSESHAQRPITTVTIGSASRIELASRDLLESLTWWARFGFDPIRRPGDRVDSALTLTDGQVVITLVKKSQPSPTLIFRADDLESMRRDLLALGFRIDADTRDSVLREIRLRSPSDVFLAIRSKREEAEIRSTAEVNPICGKLTELATSTDSLAVEKRWWTKLGFVVARGDTLPYPFVNMTSGFTEVGLHEGRNIPSLALTYFMPDMAQRINRLRGQGLDPAEVVPGPDATIRNAVYVSPDGQLLYMFEGKR